MSLSRSDPRSRFGLVSVLFLAFTLTLLIPVSSTGCRCPSNTASGMTRWVAPVPDYGVEWWYYLLNLEDASTIFYIIRISDCESFKPDTYFGQIQYQDLEDARVMFPILGESIIDPMRLNLTFEQIHLEQVSEDRLVLTHPKGVFLLQQPPVSLQGLDRTGFVPDHMPPCNGAYSASFMNVSVTGVWEKKPIQGFGYGEHVLLTTSDQINGFLRRDQKLGWHCHYLHWPHRSPSQDLQLCVGYTDPSTSHHGMLRTGNHLRWITRDEFKTEPLSYWRSPKTNISYPISWQLEVTGFGVLTTYPSWDDAELEGQTAWIGPSYTKDGGIGFTEVVFFL